MSTSNDKAVEKATAKKLITDSARDYLTAKITLPLGNPALKQLHTNMFLFTALPEEFRLKNWETIANALNSEDTRFADYQVNRWYVEGITINVEAQGKAEMSIDLNAFASSTTEFAEGRKSFEKAYADATTKNTSTNNSSTKKTTNAVKTADNSLIKDKYVKSYSIPTAVVNAVKKACKGKKTDKDKAYAWYKWMDNNVGYDYYFEHLYNPDQVIKRKKGNCVDNSRTFRLGCLAMGIKCNFVQGKSCCSGGECAGHQWNKVYINGKGVTVDCGRSNASWGSHWGNCSSTKETSTSW